MNWGNVRALGDYEEICHELQTTKDRFECGKEE